MIFDFARFQYPVLGKVLIIRANSFGGIHFRVQEHWFFIGY